MTGKRTYILITLLIPLLVIICLPVSGAETSAHDVVVRILPYSEADLTRQITVERLSSFAIDKSNGFPFFSNDFQSKRVTAFVRNPSHIGFFGDMEIEMTDIVDFYTLRQTVKTSNYHESNVEITFTITDL